MFSHWGAACDYLGGGTCEINTATEIYKVLTGDTDCIAKAVAPKGKACRFFYQTLSKTCWECRVKLLFSRLRCNISQDAALVSLQEPPAKIAISDFDRVQLLDSWNFAIDHLVTT